MSEDNLFDGTDRKERNMVARHFGYYIYNWVHDFFSSPYKKEKRELNVLGSIQTLLESEPTEENINKCKELSKLHRMVENTRARRRLEKWSLRVIAWYLLIVFAIIVLCYTNIPYIHINIPSNIMVVILTTTTVNIIGLGLIVLRGHFLANEGYDKDKDKVHNK
jgi:hypothetical protein